MPSLDRRNLNTLLDHALAPGSEESFNYSRHGAGQRRAICLQLIAWCRPPSNHKEHVVAIRPRGPDLGSHKNVQGGGSERGVVRFGCRRPGGQASTSSSRAEDCRRPDQSFDPARRILRHPRLERRRQDHVSQAPLVSALSRCGWRLRQRLRSPAGAQRRSPIRRHRQSRRLDGNALAVERTREPAFPGAYAVCPAPKRNGGRTMCSSAWKSPTKHTNIPGIGRRANNRSLAWR